MAALTSKIRLTDVTASSLVNVFHKPSQAIISHLGDRTQHARKRGEGCISYTTASVHKQTTTPQPKQYQRLVFPYTYIYTTSSQNVFLCAWLTAVLQFQKEKKKYRTIVSVTKNKNRLCSLREKGKTTYRTFVRAHLLNDAWYDKIQLQYR